MTTEVTLGEKPEGKSDQQDRFLLVAASCQDEEETRDIVLLLRLCQD